MYTNNKLAKSIRLALMFGGASLALSGAATAQDMSGEAEAEKAQERIQVTGSRIKRTDMEGSVPVTVIGRDAIDMSGDMSVSDVIRNTTFNSTGSFRPQSGSSAQGIATVDMRGLGSSRTLVLVDGRRLTMSPSTGSSQDLNAIPIGAVERIEILSDGASAIYGSDAIGGVINVITRKDYSGAQITLGAGEVSVPADGGDRENGSILFGSASADTQVMGGVSWNDREIVFERDYPWVQPGASLYGNNWINSEFTGGYAAIPGGCNEDNFLPNGALCGYNFNATNANEASSRNESLFLKANHRVNANWEIYSNATIAQTESFGRYAPAPDSNFFYDEFGGGIDENSYNNPTNPNAWMYDPRNENAVAYDPAIGAQGPVHLFHRFAAAGNRDNTVSNENLDLLFGTTGFVNDVEYDFGWRRVRNRTLEIGNGYLAAGTAWGFVEDFNPGYCTDGSFDDVNCRFGYDLQNPSSNPDNVLSGSVVTTSRSSTFDINEIYGSAGFDMFEMNGGMSQMFIGAEYRKEVYGDNYDSQSEAGLVGGSAGNSAGGSRNVKAAYFESLFPVTHDFEVSVAGRFDSYSDYGSDFSPKVSMRWEMADGYVLRGSWGQGFRAPTLDILTQKTSFSADSVSDPQTCVAFGSDPDCDTQINAYRIANPDLESESSTQIAFGFAAQPTDWLNFTVDYYDIKVTNRIAFFSSQGLLDRMVAGDAIPAGLGVTRRDNGSIEQILTGYGNEGELETSGLDLKVGTEFDFGDAGSLNSQVQWSHVLEYIIDGERDRVKDTGRPADRVVWNNSYNFNDLTFAYNLNLIGNQFEDVTAKADGGVDRSGNIGTWVTHDIQATYSASWDGKITFGIQNAFEKLPQLSGFGGRDYNYDLYNGWGRVYYVRYQQNF